LISADQETIEFLAKELRAAVDSENHRSPERFALTELLEAVNNVAANDNNKHKLVAGGVLDSYVRLMEADCSAEEHTLAVQGLLTLVKICPERIDSEHGLKKGD